MKIEIEKIKSENGLLELKDLLKGNVRNSEGLEIFETSTKKTWINFGGFNGCFTDLWLKKSGTTGSQNRSFVRCSVGKYTDIFNELKWMEIQPSIALLALVEKERANELLELVKTQNIIDNYNDIEKLHKWKEKLIGKNSQQSRTFCKNKLINLGATIVPGGYAREFQYKIMQAI
jgi:hypothetical protein